MLVSTHGRPTPQSVMSLLTGWLVLCVIIIGVVYLFVVKRCNRKDTDGTE